MFGMIMYLVLGCSIRERSDVRIVTVDEYLFVSELNSVFRSRENV